MKTNFLSGDIIKKGVKCMKENERGRLLEGA